jgi:hypothetical protein
MSGVDSQIRSVSGFSSESWEVANAFTDTLGRYPASVTSLVRFLFQDFDADPSTLSPDSRFMLVRFLKSRAVQAPYFYSMGFFRSDNLVPMDRAFVVDDFIEGFSAPEHALILGLLFSYRMALRSNNVEMIEEILPRLQYSANIGWLSGEALKHVGSFSGMLVGLYGWLGVLPFAKHDPEGFKFYLRHLRKEEASRPDVEFEHQRWGCTSTQVGILLLQRLGFGVSRLVPLMRATTTRATLGGLEPAEKRFRVAEVWVRYLVERRSSPSIPLPPAFYLSEADINFIVEKVTDKTAKRNSEWLQATKDWVSPTSTPQLFTPQYIQSTKVEPPQGDSAVSSEGEPLDESEIEQLIEPGE